LLIEFGFITNEMKHGIAFEEARTVFFDENAKLLVFQNLIFIALQNRLADSKLIHSESTFLRCGLFFLYERFHKPSDVEY
jgi:hypothetical protein